ncbi:uncharacterized protein LOC130621858 [Hydractinia symbiolongicarpus]|uniref:uncharacterized protein LOC130621858 n=1 Tax=Hydractinia symbiolongicarpus TaxID=13093 RepID=UPI00254A1CB7|nr:uncharacterized protein LOC130621858 [Hydractinia symbiolongicarpus]
MKRYCSGTKVYLNLYALKDIEMGTELRYDYGDDPKEMLWRTKVENLNPLQLKGENVSPLQIGDQNTILSEKQDKDVTASQRQGENTSSLQLQDHADIDSIGFSQVDIVASSDSLNTDKKEVMSASKCLRDESTDGKNRGDNPSCKASKEVCMSMLSVNKKTITRDTVDPGDKDNKFILSTRDSGEILLPMPPVKEKNIANDTGVGLGDSLGEVIFTDTEELAFTLESIPNEETNSNDKNKPLNIDASKDDKKSPKKVESTLRVTEPSNGEEDSEEGTVVFSAEIRDDIPMCQVTNVNNEQGFPLNTEDLLNTEALTFSDDEEDMTNNASIEDVLKNVSGIKLSTFKGIYILYYNF